MYDQMMGECTLKRKKLFLLDMDGTIYLDETLFPGAKEFLERIKKDGNRYVFLTNNSSKGVESYIEKMDRLEIKTTREDFLTSIDCLIEKLKDSKDIPTYIMGTKSFVKQMTDSGFNILTDLELAGDESKENIVKRIILGFDRELSFNKLDRVCRILSKDKNGTVSYLATNPDWVCPTSYGYVPDCGSFSKIIQIATGREPKFIGKPEPDMVNMAVSKFGVDKKDTVVIGDRIYTDIKAGVNANVDTIFVLSGEGVMGDIEKYNVKPTYILKSVADIF